MKKPIFTFVVVLVFSICFSQLIAQKTSYRIFKKGQKDAWIGIGLLPTYLMDGGKIVLPPLTTGADYMVADYVSIGGQVGYSISEFQKRYTGPELTKHYQSRFYFVSLRAAVHCTKIENWDIYGGFALGYNLAKVSVVDGSFGKQEPPIGIKPRQDKVTYSGLLGVRFACCSKIGAFVEIGYGASLVMIGTIYRI